MSRGEVKRSIYQRNFVAPGVVANVFAFVDVPGKSRRLLVQLVLPAQPVHQ